MDMTDNPNYYFIERPYKSKYICTDCRKSFKRKLLADITTDKDIEEKEPKCPDCGKLTSWIGPKFRPPKTDNVKAWNSIKALHDIGLLNFIGWANNYVDIPETKKSLNDFLNDLKENYEWNIKRWTTTEYSPDNKNQIKYFSEAIKKIDKHLQTK
jgi:DNA-directed RNA polymerase subunit RPC12/RpoP